MDFPGLWAGDFLCHLSVLWIESISIFGWRIWDCGLREGGAAEAAHFLLGFCTGGLKDQMSHSLQVEVIPRPPAGEAPERSEGEGGRSFPHVETGSEDFMRNVFSGVICQIMRFEAASISGISLKTTCPDRFFFEISGYGMRGAGRRRPDGRRFFMGALHGRVERPVPVTICL